MSKNEIYDEESAASGEVMEEAPVAVAKKKKKMYDKLVRLMLGLASRKESAEELEKLEQDKKIILKKVGGPQPTWWPLKKVENEYVIDGPKRQMTLVAPYCMTQTPGFEFLTDDNEEIRVGKGGQVYWKVRGNKRGGGLWYSNIRLQENVLGLLSQTDIETLKLCSLIQYKAAEKGKKKFKVKARKSGYTILKIDLPARFHNLVFEEKSQDKLDMRLTNASFFVPQRINDLFKEKFKNAATRTYEFPGIIWDASNKKWVAQITENGKKIYIKKTEGGGLKSNPKDLEQVVLKKLVHQLNNKNMACIELYKGNTAEGPHVLKARVLTFINAVAGVTPSSGRRDVLDLLSMVRPTWQRLRAAIRKFRTPKKRTLNSFFATSTKKQKKI